MRLNVVICIARLLIKHLSSGFFLHIVGSVDWACHGSSKRTNGGSDDGGGRAAKAGVTEPSEG